MAPAVRRSVKTMGFPRAETGHLVGHTARERAHPGLSRHEEERKIAVISRGAAKWYWLPFPKGLWFHMLSQGSADLVSPKYEITIRLRVSQTHGFVRCLAQTV